jgi:hypothetical protein
MRPPGRGISERRALEAELEDCELGSEKGAER